MMKFAEDWEFLNYIERPIWVNCSHIHKSIGSTIYDTENIARKRIDAMSYRFVRHFLFR